MLLEIAFRRDACLQLGKGALLRAQLGLQTAHDSLHRRDLVLRSRLELGLRALRLLTLLRELLFQRIGLVLLSLERGDFLPEFFRLAFLFGKALRRCLELVLLGLRPRRLLRRRRLF